MTYQHIHQGPYNIIPPEPQGGYPSAVPPSPGYLGEGYPAAPAPPPSYQGYFNSDYPPPPPPPPPPAQHMHHQSYGTDGCPSLLRGCLAAFCCCCLMEECCWW